MAKISAKGTTRMWLNGEEVKPEYISKLSFVRDDTAPDSEESPAQFPTFTATVSGKTDGNWGALDNAIYRFLFAMKQEAARRKKAFARWN